MIGDSAGNDDLEVVILRDSHHVAVKVLHLLQGEGTSLFSAEDDVEKTIGVGMAAH